MFSRFDSFESFHAHIVLLIAANELDKALVAIHDYVNRINSESLCASQVLGSRKLDMLCQQIGARAILVNGRVHKSAQQEISEKDTFVYLVTKIQKSGGHIKVIEDFIRAKPNDKHILLLTGLEGRSHSDLYISRFPESISVSIEESPTKKYLGTLHWLQDRLLEIQPNSTYLFNHHQDSVAVAAIQPRMLNQASFYHHGDHHLCLGVHLDHLSHIDFHPMGFNYCKDHLNINNRYVPLVADDKEVISKKHSFKEDGYLVTATAGRSNKIEVPYYVSYFEVIPDLLYETKGKHIHIGHLSKMALFMIRWRLRSLGVPKSSFIYIPWVPSVWKTLRKYKVDLYIASFPYGGAITLIEAMGAGIPVALHRHIYSRVLSCIDMGYEDVFYWDDQKDLIKYCKNLSDEDFARLSVLARLQYEKYHHPRILYDVLNKSSFIEAPSNIISSYEPNRDELIFWMERQVSLHHLIKRSLYRILKRIRANFF